MQDSYGIFFYRENSATDPRTMWKSTLMVTVFCAVTLAVPVPKDDGKNDEKAFLSKQKNLLRLFRHIHRPSYYADQAQIAKDLDNEQRVISDGTVSDFMKLHRKGFLPRGKVFSIFNDKHRQQAVALFGVLYVLPTWQEFYRFACWAREHVNEGMFVYAMHVTVFHRPDMRGLMLPPIYEINPHFFVDGHVIDEANALVAGAASRKQNVFFVDANYTDSRTNAPAEQKALAHIYNDVRLNAKYFYFHVMFPFWMKTGEYGLNGSVRGELFYFFHEQMLARYYLERLANGYGAVDVYSWQWPIATGYNSALRYPTGAPFPSRPAGAHLIFDANSNSSVAGETLFRIDDIEDYEHRLRDAVDFGYILTSDVRRISIYKDIGFNGLGNLAECNADSVNRQYFGPLSQVARHALGYTSPAVNASTVVPSVLEHYETSIRDPIFFQFFKRVVHYLARYKDHLPEYNQTELACPGVSVTGVSFSELRTFWEKFDFEVTNAVHSPRMDDFQVWARQYRLNHKPFSYKIIVTSAGPRAVVVRAFIGPKYDESGAEIELNDNRLNFVEFDKFTYILQAGENVIARDSDETKSANDQSNFQSLYQGVEAALRGDGVFKRTLQDIRQGFVMPKGSSEGTPFKFFVFISQGAKEQKMGDVSLGYPLDRQISYEDSFLGPNAYLFDEKIYHSDN